MTEEIDIYRTANLLIKQHGKDAPVHAAMRADELLAARDVEGCATWRRVVRAVKELLDDQPPGEGKVVH
jgi:hypothetical protein